MSIEELGSLREKILECEKILSDLEKDRFDFEKHGLSSKDEAIKYYVDTLDTLHKNEDLLVMPLLRDPNLIEHIISRISEKVPGQEIQKKALLLSLSSIFVSNAEPIHIILNSESSAGKSFLMKIFRKLFPKNMYEYRTRITPKAFTYWRNVENYPDWTWDGKICFLEDVGSNILNCEAMKVMMSEGSIATVVIKQKSVDVEIKGKPAICITTARGVPNQEILSRCVLITLDETQEQTKRIFEIMGKAEVECKSEDYSKIQNAFSILERVKVRIPFADKISFHFPSHLIRARRDLKRLFGMIKSSAALHQYQRQIDENGYILTNTEDYENAREVLIGLTHDGELGLTHSEKKALQELRYVFDNIDNKYSKDMDDYIDNKDSKYNNYTKDGFLSVKEIHSKKPVRAEENWRKILNKLAEKEFLDVNYFPDNKNRDVIHYKLKNKKNVYNIPKAEDLLSESSKESVSKIEGRLG